MGRAFMACGVLAVGIAGIAAHAGTQASTTKAITLKPLSIVKLRDLDFGRLIAGVSAGTVFIDPNTDTRSTTGGTTAAGGTPQAAQFYTYATANTTLQVNRGPLPILNRSGGGATMNVTGLTLNGPVGHHEGTKGFKFSAPSPFRSVSLYQHPNLNLLSGNSLPTFA